ncbi:hypothetical protein AB0F73_28535 [Micromonospora purpureochromogenes]|uniref:DUF7144 family membrane protein n=1 Tax=Micromonospora purpureochromogenes TaxID=47872 RepID=UPI0033E2BC58
MGFPQPVDTTGAPRPGPPLLAGALLTTSGLVDLLSSWANTTDDPFVVQTGRGMYLVDITGWAWLHVVIGAAVTLAGLAAATGRRGTASVALGCAVLGAAIDLLLFPYAPLRALLVVGLDGAVLWLLLRHRRMGRATGGFSGARRPGPSSPDPPPWSPTRSD